MMPQAGHSQDIKHTNNSNSKQRDDLEATDREANNGKHRRVGRGKQGAARVAHASDR